jgi:hypothetical protein
MGGELWFNVNDPQPELAKTGKTGFSMTDANPEDPRGEKSEEEPEKPRSFDAEAGQSSAQGTADEFAGWGGFQSETREGELEKPRFTIAVPSQSSTQKTDDQFAGWAGFKSETREGEPEKPRSSVTEAGQLSAKNTADEVTGWAGFKSEKKEGEPEGPRSSITEAGQSSVKGTAETVKLPGLKEKKPDGEPEKPRSFVAGPGLASAPNTAGEVAGKPVPKREKKEREPEKPRSSIMEAGPSNAQGTAATARVPGPKGEKPEGEPEQPPYSITEPGQERTQGVATKAGAEESSDESGEEKPEPLGYSIIEPPPEPPKDFAKLDLRVPASASGAATANHPNGQAAAPLPPTLQAPIEQVQRSAPNQIRVYVLAVVGMGLLVGCIVAFFYSRMSSTEGQYDLGPVTSSGAGLRGHLYTRWDKKLEYRLSFGPSAPEQQAGFALAVAHSPRPVSISIHLQDAQGFVLCSKEVVLKYAGGDAPASDAPNPDAAGGKANAANLPGVEPTHGMQDLLAAQEAERELGKDVFKNEIGPDGQITGINAQGEMPCTEKIYANASSWSFTTNFPSLAEQEELGKHQEVAQANEERPSAKAGSRRKAAAVPAPVLLPFSIEGDDAIVEFDLSSGVIETRDNKTFLVGKAIAISLDSRWLEFPVSIHYRCDQTSTCTLTHAGAGALRARLKR